MESFGSIIEARRLKCHFIAGDTCLFDGPCEAGREREHAQSLPPIFLCQDVNNASIFMIMYRCRRRRRQLLLPVKLRHCVFGALALEGLRTLFSGGFFLMCREKL